MYSHQKEESPPDTDTVWLAAHFEEVPDSGSLTMVLAVPPNTVPPWNEVLFVRNTPFQGVFGGPRKINKKQEAATLHSHCRLGVPLKRKFFSILLHQPPERRARDSVLPSDNTRGKICLLHLPHHGHLLLLRELTERLPLHEGLDLLLARHSVLPENVFPQSPSVSDLLRYRLLLILSEVIKSDETKI